MTLQKFPTGVQVQRFVDDNPREEGEDMEAHVRRLLRGVVAANVATTVALKMGTSPNKISVACKGVRAQLAMMCRIAEACDCEITVRPRP